jgi:pimeloyl-ACP methyl ester carboxylesterase
LTAARLRTRRATTSRPAKLGGEPPGRWWGPGARALGFEPGQTVERQPYDLLFGERKAPEGTQLGRPSGDGRKAAGLYAQLLAAEPHATAERKRELRTEAAKKARQSPYRVSGHGRPVVLIHGFTVTSTVNYATHYVYADDGGLEATAGPTVESALLDAGFQVVMYDLRGHGHSAKPHDPGCYSMDAHVGDVQALVGHLSLDRPAVVGYSLGSVIAGRLLGSSWESAAALCGTVSFHVEGEEDLVGWADLARCFSEGRWDDYPDYGIIRSLAELSGNRDFIALGAVAQGVRGMPKAILSAATMPVLVLNGGADDGAMDEYDLTPFVSGARRAVEGGGDHMIAPSDPLFHSELASFLQTAT